jgi:SpoVK/Ycf46/Vps4 family AAA+-type ATPase
MALSPEAREALAEVADATANYSGADLSGIMTEAQLLALHDVLAALEAKGKAGLAATADERRPAAPEDAPEVVISAENLRAALRASATSLSGNDRQRYERIYRSFLHARTDSEPAFDPQGKQRVVSA